MSRIDEIEAKLAYWESSGEPYSWAIDDLNAELDYLEELKDARKEDISCWPNNADGLLSQD